MLDAGAGVPGIASRVCGDGDGWTCWSVGSVLSQRVLPLAPGAMGFASEMLAGGAGVAGVWPASRASRMSWPPEPLAAWAWVYLVVFGSLLAFNAYMVLLARTSARTRGKLHVREPHHRHAARYHASASETITTQEWAAAGVILSAVVLLLVRPSGSGNR